MVTVLKSGLAAPAITSAATVSRFGAVAQLEQLPQVVGALRFGAFLLQSHLQRLEFLLERDVSFLHLLQRNIAGPACRARRQ